MKNAPQLACVSMPSVLSSWLLFFSLRHRFGYSLFEEVDCHRDRGGRGFCFGKGLGALTAVSISNVY